MAKAQLPVGPSIPVPRWADVGVCRGLDPEIFYLDADDDADFPNFVAQAACTRCPILHDCLQWALDTGEKYGVWGNTTPRQRQKLLRPVMRVRCPGCSSNAILEEPTSEMCLSCGLTWKI